MKARLHGKNTTTTETGNLVKQEAEQRLFINFNITKNKIGKKSLEKFKLYL